MQALRKAGYNLDEVVSAKRNGTVIAMDAELSHEDVLLISVGKIKGGAEGDDQETGNVIKLSFEIVKENTPESNGQLAFLDTQSTFEIIRQVMHSRGVSLNYLKDIKDSEWNSVPLSSQLVDGWNYKIVICDTRDCGEGCDDED